MSPASPPVFPPAAPPVVTACIVIIGSEVLSGRTRDANLAWLATTLNDCGIRVREARVIPDDPAVIVETVNAARAAFDYVFTTGGIGPTHDDITSACIAEAFGVPLERRPDAVRLLEQQYAPADLNAARLKMADIPAGAALIDNPVSRAPGFRLENVYVLPGVPRIMQAMVEGLRDHLSGGVPLVSRTISVYLTEGTIAAGLAAIQGAYLETEIGSYPFVRDGRLGTSLVARAADANALEAATAAIRALVRELGGDPIEDEAA